jgi:hypothetical protein
MPRGLALSIGQHLRQGLHTAGPLLRTPDSPTANNPKLVWGKNIPEAVHLEHHQVLHAAAVFFTVAKGAPTCSCCPATPIQNLSPVCSSCLLHCCTGCSTQLAAAQQLQPRPAPVLRLRQHLLIGAWRSLQALPAVVSAVSWQT